MFARFLLTIVLASTLVDDQSDAATLIGRLGAQSFDDRVAACKALEQLGTKALPALRAAALSGDSHVRSRARALIDAIAHQVESDRVARPIMVRLDFRDRALGQVVDTLNERFDLGLSLRLGPEPPRGMLMVDPGQPGRLKAMRDRKITLEAAQPLPYWEAIDRLCKAGALHYSATTGHGFSANQGSLVLMADRTGRGPVSDSGPFRVQITNFHSVFEHDFTQDRDPALRAAKPPGAGDLTITLAVLTEPGMTLHRNGAVIVTEASDDRGRSMAPSAPAQFDSGQDERTLQVMNGLGAFRVNAVLAAPDAPGTVIRRLRGKVPVIAVMNGSDPIVVPLSREDPTGKMISTRDMTLVVDEAVLAPGAPASVKLTFRFDQGDLAASARSDPRRPGFAAFDRDRVLERLELRDAAGRRLNHILGEQTRGADGHGFYDRYRLVVAPALEHGPGGGQRTSKTPIPAELRYYRLVQTATEVPFDFRDVPMP